MTRETQLLRDAKRFGLFVACAGGAFVGQTAVAKRFLAPAYESWREVAWRLLVLDTALLPPVLLAEAAFVAGAKDKAKEERPPALL